VTSDEAEHLFFVVLRHLDGSVDTRRVLASGAAVAIEFVANDNEPVSDRILAVFPVDVDINNSVLTLRRDIADILALEGKPRR
jgi:hypothetical protein